MQLIWLCANIHICKIEFDVCPWHGYPCFLTDSIDLLLHRLPVVFIPSILLILIITSILSIGLVHVVRLFIWKVLKR